MIKGDIKILVTGGGSGGHISVAKALIDAVVEDYNIPKKNIIYVGGDLGMEYEEVGNSLEKRVFKESGFKTYFIRAGKLHRRFSLKRAKFLLRTLLGLFDALKIIKKERPTFVISTGGFVSVPVCIVSWLYKTPIYLHEQTASVGLSNKIVGKFASRIYISFKDSLRYFPEEKCIHVGNVVRKDIFQKKITSNTDLEIISLVNTDTNLPFIYISGGSLGSHTINQKIQKELENLLPFFRILLQTGENKIFKDYEEIMKIKGSLKQEYQDRLVIKKYIDKYSIGYVLNNMDLFLGRAGANTVYEIGVLEKFALFIPIPWVTHNEQYLNAKVLHDIGTANILQEKDLDNANLKYEIERLFEQTKLRKIDYEKLKALFPTNATYYIIDEIFSKYLK